ncbi:DUF3788 domain-containing protein [Myxococcota bacterium]|nr:DUF3788 domain-containing protein [Myxococcota bacterium]
MPSVFVDGRERPDDSHLAAALGPAKAAWDAVLALAAELAPRSTPEWKFYGARHGWQLKILEKKRSLLYLVPGDGSFVAALALDDAALASLEGSKLPAAMLEEIKAAKKAPEGHPARVTVKAKRELTHVAALLRAKLGARDASLRG